MPGILTEWPWKSLGSFKYLIMAPWVIHSTLLFMMNDGKDRDITYFFMFPLTIWRMIHNQIWITLSRYRTAKGNGRIFDKGLEFDQVDRERNWDDQILFNGTLLYLANRFFPGAQKMPLWRMDGVVSTILLHADLVEYLYYWCHRALHHHYLYSRYHSHHHSSIVTEPITSVIHPFAEHIVYSLLFSIPMLATVFMGTVSVISFAGYITYIDFMNNMGHCNFELIPNCLLSLSSSQVSYVYPFVRISLSLSLSLFTRAFHYLHHTQFQINYSLFMSFYDYIYGTMDKSTDSLYETSLKREEKSPDTRRKKLIYHAFASLSFMPHTSKWYLWLMWPVTFWYMVLIRICGRTFVIERQRFNKLRLQTWVIPKYTLQYYLRFQKGAINSLIEEAIVQAERKGVKFISLGLLNQGEELNRYGGPYVERHPHLKIKVVDGSSLAVAVILNSIPKRTTQVVLRGNLTKVVYAIAYALSQKGIQVATLHQDEYIKLTKSLSATESSLVLAESHAHKIWLVGDGLTEKEQLSAPSGTLFVPFSQLPPKKLRKDCFYHYTPAMKIPTSLENVHSCENWLPRRVMSAWRIAGIRLGIRVVFSHHVSTEKIWQASLRHGFHPLVVTTQPMLLSVTS
ncbi:unnamed protein product [Malus baccata var. baccata]